LGLVPPSYSRKIPPLDVSILFVCFPWERICSFKTLWLTTLTLVCVVSFFLLFFMGPSAALFFFSLVPPNPLWLLFWKSYSPHGIPSISVETPLTFPSCDKMRFLNNQKSRCRPLSKSPSQLLFSSPPCALTSSCPHSPMAAPLLTKLVVGPRCVPVPFPPPQPLVAFRSRVESSLFPLHVPFTDRDQAEALPVRPSYCFRGVPIFRVRVVWFVPSSQPNLVFFFAFFSVFRVTVSSPVAPLGPPFGGL